MEGLTDLFAKMFVVALVVVFGYVLWRVFWYGAARSWFEGKFKFEKGEQDAIVSDKELSKEEIEEMKKKWLEGYKGRGSTFQFPKFRKGEKDGKK